MHLHAGHAEYHIPTLLQFLKRNPLGLLITSINSAGEARLQASHLPWVIHQSRQEDGLPILRSHIARANPQTKAIVEQCQSQESTTSAVATLKDDILIMFNGPVHGYVSPRWYVETKPKTGKVVPTWDYTAVQAYGRAKIFHATEPETTTFLTTHLAALAAMTESEMMGFSKPWEMSDAPQSYTDMLMRGIIGIEVELTRLEGRMKLSQDKSPADREGVVEGLAGLNTPAGDMLADQVRVQAKISDERKAAAKSEGP